MGRLRAMPPLVGSAPSRLRVPPKLADGFYQSAEWRALVARIKRDRGAWCERCGSRHRLIADHVIELRDGGAPLDASNVELLCQAHHNEKTATARTRRARTAT